MKINITKQQRRALLLCLAKEQFDIDIIPEAGKQMPKVKGWFEFIDGLSDEKEKPTIPLNRELKITILKAVQTGVFDVLFIKSTIEAEEKRDRFLELMQAATAEI